MSKSLANEVSRVCIGVAIEVQNVLGPGLLERGYQEAMLIELELRGLHAESEVAIPSFYKGRAIGTVYRADIVVEGAVVIECKCVAQVLDVHRAQLLTYLRHGGYGVGLLFNFRSRLIVDDMVRMVNGEFSL